MKKVILALSLFSVAVVGYSQGLVSTINPSTALITTNNSVTLASGPTQGANNYYFALLTAPTASFGVAASVPTLSALANGTGWTYTGITTASIASAGRENGGANVATTAGWPAGVTNSFILVGWSANLGTTWSAVAAEILNGNDAGGYVGESSVGFGQAGGGPDSLPAFVLFGTGAESTGTPITSGFALNYIVPVPEPTTLALTALGGAAMLFIRRKK